MRADSLVVVLVVILQGASAASALERIKTRPPTSAEAHRIASELAMDDSTLQKGDIVSTDRGFFVYRGIGADGYTSDFAPWPIHSWPIETASLRVTLDRRGLSGLWKNLGDNGRAQFSTKSERAL